MLQLLMTRPVKLVLSIPTPAMDLAGVKVLRHFEGPSGYFWCPSHDYTWPI